MQPQDFRHWVLSGATQCGRKPSAERAMAGRVFWQIASDLFPVVVREGADPCGEQSKSCGHLSASFLRFFVELPLTAIEIYLLGPSLSNNLWYGGNRCSTTFRLSVTRCFSVSARTSPGERTCNPLSWETTKFARVLPST